jgi:SAM-dependent methyltransferase
LVCASVDFYRRVQTAKADTVTEPTKSEQLRTEFNRWAESGKAESMQHEHWPITAPVLELMRLRDTDNVIDVGCGGGWLSRILSQRLPDGRVVGMDISDEMVRHAREANTDLDNTMFVVGSVDEIPWEAQFFDKMISVESSYYWPEPARGLKETYRVLRDGGSAWILINYYRDNPYSHHWGALLDVPTHLLSAEAWVQLFLDAGFSEAEYRLVPDPTPTPEVYAGRWFRDASELRAFREMGALLIYGTKG